jgi:hypothetical protein
MRIEAAFVFGAAMLAVGGGCAIHDGRPESEPVWWPTPMVRASTFQSSGGTVNLQPAPLDLWLPPLDPDGSLKTP